jgi:hypothetical protein
MPFRFATYPGASIGRAREQEDADRTAELVRLSRQNAALRQEARLEVYRAMAIGTR